MEMHGLKFTSTCVIVALISIFRLFRFSDNLLIAALADNWKHIIVKFVNIQ